MRHWLGFSRMTPWMIGTTGAPYKSKTKKTTPRESLEFAEAVGERCSREGVVIPYLGSDQLIYIRGAPYKSKTKKTTPRESWELAEDVGERCSREGVVILYLGSGIRLYTSAAFFLFFLHQLRMPTSSVRCAHPRRRGCPVAEFQSIFIVLHAPNLHSLSIPTKLTVI